MPFSLWERAASPPGLAYGLCLLRSLPSRAGTGVTGEAYASAGVGSSSIAQGTSTGLKTDGGVNVECGGGDAMSPSSFSSAWPWSRRPSLSIELIFSGQSPICRAGGPGSELSDPCGLGFSTERQLDGGVELLCTISLEVLGSGELESSGAAECSPKAGDGETDEKPAFGAEIGPGPWTSRGVWIHPSAASKPVLETFRGSRVRAAPHSARQAAAAGNGKQASGCLDGVGCPVILSPMNQGGASAFSFLHGGV